MYTLIFLHLLRNLTKASTGHLSGCNKVTVQGDINVGKSMLDISYLCRCTYFCLKQVNVDGFHSSP